ncbi:MAG: hypothetical protein GY761_06030 [Hyphomicrobiales bacterium]|nr:hypothetical protein [Hyphomicrobiales bacterium]
MEELGKSRVIVRNIESGLGIIIPSRRQYFVLAFLLFWICGWTIGGISAISALLIDNVPLTAQTFMLFWLGGWALGWFFAATTILWQLFGEEVIIVTSGVLTIYRRLIFDFGKKMYAVANVKNMEHTPHTESSFFQKHSQNTSIFGVPAVSFDYGAKSVRLGRGLDNAEVRMLLGTMKKKIPSVFSD